MKINSITFFDLGDVNGDGHDDLIIVLPRDVMCCSERSMVLQT